MNLPVAFEERMREHLGKEYGDFRESLEAEPVASIRINTHKPMPPQQWTAVPWCANGRYLPSRPSFTLDPLFHAGAYYVQEASSMFLEQAVLSVVNTNEPINALDLCAAPGGKSTHLLSLLSADSVLVSNEVIRSRATILSENICKWGHPNVIVTNNDPSSFHQLGEYFDLIVVDAPCSGEGLFRKDSDAAGEWSVDNANLCALRQRRILNDIWPALKPGGFLIYCTCTYNAEENEKNLDHFAASNAVEFHRVRNVFPGVTEVRAGKAAGYQLYPHRVNGEGFFLSILQKTSSTGSGVRGRRESPRKHGHLPASWLNGNFTGTMMGDLWVAWPERLSAAFTNMASALNIVTRGTAMGTMMKNRLVPDHALAMSIYLDRTRVEMIELDRHHALEYLRRSATLGDHPSLHDGSKGHALVTHGNIGLGWINRLGNRINNMYPAAWRIRMS